MKVNIPKKSLDWVRYWMSCYECPEINSPCSGEKPCKFCKINKKAKDDFDAGVK